MKFTDFRAMVDRLARDVPPAFQDGIVAIDAPDSRSLESNHR